MGRQAAERTSTSASVIDRADAGQGRVFSAQQLPPRGARRELRCARVVRTDAKTADFVHIPFNIILW